MAGELGEDSGWGWGRRCDGLGQGGGACEDLTFYSHFLVSLLTDKQQVLNRRSQVLPPLGESATDLSGPPFVNEQGPLGTGGGWLGAEIRVGVLEPPSWVSENGRQICNCCLDPPESWSVSCSRCFSQPLIFPVFVGLF